MPTPHAAEIVEQTQKRTAAATSPLMVVSLSHAGQTVLVPQQATGMPRGLLTKRSEHTSEAPQHRVKPSCKSHKPRVESRVGELSWRRLRADQPTRNLKTYGLFDVPTMITSPSCSVMVPPRVSPPTRVPSTMVPQVLSRSTST